ncbi:MAG TPA: DUF3460 family protein [Casimicrobiaceae bacterium]|nr:DUF3460 family protein [Casimicrobiaceae bacterium]
MMLPSRHYESDITRFIRELKAERPELDRDQQNGRAIFWDKPPQDLAERSRMDQGRVQQQAYVYQTSVK